MISQLSTPLSREEVAWAATAVGALRQCCDESRGPFERKLQNAAERKGLEPRLRTRGAGVGVEVEEGFLAAVTLEREEANVRVPCVRVVCCLHAHSKQLSRQLMCMCTKVISIVRFTTDCLQPSDVEFTLLADNTEDKHRPVNSQLALQAFTRPLRACQTCNLKAPCL
jgi:hypothetical protein